MFAVIRNLTESKEVRHRIDLVEVARDPSGENLKQSVETLPIGYVRVSIN
jgi:hypothetical protein